MKINAKLPLLYSILNPDTISDSPSAKSKGARFVSARFVMNQIIHTGDIRNIGQIFCVKIILLNENVCVRISIDSKMSVILTS